MKKKNQLLTSSAAAALRAFALREKKEK